MEKNQLFTVVINELSESISKQIIPSIQDFIKKTINDSKGKNNQKEFLTRKEAADLLGITFGGLHKWVKEGKLKSIKIGNKPYFKYSQIIELLEQK